VDLVDRSIVNMMSLMAAGTALTVIGCVRSRSTPSERISSRMRDHNTVILLEAARNIKIAAQVS